MGRKTFSCSSIGALNTYGTTGDVRREIADFDEAARLDPTYAPAYRSRALAYYGKDDYARAVSDLSRAIELEPDNALSF